MRTGSLIFAGDGDHQAEQPHYLEACFLCRKSLGFNSDIFMYRGNTPFCSRDCREEQIEIDEAKEKRWRHSSSSSSSSSSRSHGKSGSEKKNVRVGPVAVA